MAIFKKLVSFARKVFRALARSPAHRRVQWQAAPVPVNIGLSSKNRRSLRIARHRFRKLTIDTNVDSVCDGNLPSSRTATTRVMTFKQIKMCGCKCRRTPFHPKTGLAQSYCYCYFLGPKNAAEYFGQDEDTTDHLYS
jgi:hypothetical protein